MASPHPNLGGLTLTVWARLSALEAAASKEGNPLPEESHGSGDSTKKTWTWIHASLASGDFSCDPLEIKIDDVTRPSWHGRVLKVPNSPSKGKGKGKGKNKKEGDLVLVGNPNALEIDPPHDLIALPQLNEPTVVHALRARYESDNIYSSTGSWILLVLNPFKDMSAVYGEDAMEKYFQNGQDWEDYKKKLEVYFEHWQEQEDEMEATPPEPPEPLPPHCYRIADVAFRNMMGLDAPHNADTAMAASKASKSPIEKKDQSLLVSGESGSGKTYNTRQLLRYLATLSARRAMASGRRKRPTLVNMPQRRGSHRHPKDSHSLGPRRNTWQMGADIETKLVESNPILEAFGNARTIRNDNSSRFGKYIELKFKSATTGSMIGATIETYLLEKVRLTTPISKGERTFHIFYEILSAATDEEREDLFLGDLEAKDFKLTSSSGTYDRRDGVDDMDCYDELLTAMSTMGFDPDQSDDIMKVVAAVLHSTNVQVSGSRDHAQLDLVDDPHVTAITKLLSLPSKEAFQNSICFYEMAIGRDKIQKKRAQPDAIKAMEALFKATYSALFNHIVTQINDKIAAATNSILSGAGNQEQLGKIGVLDIFGFESFDKNSFEQLCINYCNEALQLQFNDVVFTAEKEEYRKEGITMDMNFPSNQDSLDLIDKKGFGILSQLNDTCTAPTASDKGFSRVMYDGFKKKPHPNFQASPLHMGKSQFIVHHYAGPVLYDIAGFVEKNMDEVPKEALALLASSSNPFVVKLGEIITLPAPSAKPATPSKPASKVPAFSRGPAKKKKATVGSNFKIQLNELRERINATSQNYVRCLKPNQELLPDSFDPEVIADQLRCLGVLEAVEISRSGYPQRFPHDSFVERYYNLALDDIRKAKNDGKSQEELCRVILTSAEMKSSSDDMPSYQLGKTKVFMKTDLFEDLDSRRNKIITHAAVKIQSIGRGYLSRKLARCAMNAIIIQSWIRRYLASKHVDHLREERRREEERRRAAEEEKRKKLEAEQAAIRKKEEEKRKKLEAEQALRVEQEKRKRLEAAKKLIDLKEEETKGKRDLGIKMAAFRLKEEEEERERAAEERKKMEEKERRIAAEEERRIAAEEEESRKAQLEEQQNIETQIRLDALATINDDGNERRRTISFGGHKEINPDENEEKAEENEKTPAQLNEERRLRIEKRRKDRERQARAEYLSLRARGGVLRGRVGQQRMQEATRLVNQLAAEAKRKEAALRWTHRNTSRSAY